MDKSNNIELIIRGKTFLAHNTLLSVPYPQTLSFEATNFCNLACSHCGHSQFPGFSKGHFDMKYFHKVEHLLGTQIKGLALSNFGEPFMSKTWQDLLSKSLSLKSTQISFITNGLLLDRHIEEVLDPRISLAISVDGASEETYGFFRDKNNFSKLTANLTLLKEAKSAEGISFPPVTFLFTVSRINSDDLPRIIDMAATFGVAVIIVQFQIFYNRERFTRESLFFAKDAYDRDIASARRRAAALGITLIHPDSFNGQTVVPKETLANWLSLNTEGNVVCASLSAVCHIKYNGIIEACCAPDHNIMGSLDFDSFEDIWNGPQYRDLRLNLDRGIWPDRCRSCSLIQVIDVNDARAHFTELSSPGVEKKPAPQSYRITEVERIYQEALSFMNNDPEGAIRSLDRMPFTDDSLYELRNLEACLRGLRGDLHAMRAGFTKCFTIAPKDPIVRDNYTTLSALCLG